MFPLFPSYLAPLQYGVSVCPLVRFYAPKNYCIPKCIRLYLLNLIRDNRLERFVAGAQDNSVQITPPAKSGSIRAIGVVGGDGTRTYIDNMHCPARMLGSCQFLNGLASFSGDPLESVTIPLAEKHFTDVRDFPFFVPAANLNSQDPSQFFFWVNRSDASPARPSTVFQVVVPEKKSDAVDPVAAFVIPGDQIILDLSIGGFTNGKSDPTAFRAVSNTHLFSSTNMSIVQRFDLPMK